MEVAAGRGRANWSRTWTRKSRRSALATGSAYCRAETNVDRLLMEAQIFVLSTHFEALPISILEAMRAGLPVVATDVGGISESVRHQENRSAGAPRETLRV